MRLGMTPTGVAVEIGGALYALDTEADLTTLIESGTKVDDIPRRERLPTDALLAPLRPRQIVAIGLNYLDHIKESGVETPKSPLIFAKLPSSVIGPGGSVIVDSALTERVDWEAELAVVIGRPMRNVARSQALDYVFGYAAANDISARDLQFGDGQWVRGKSLDTFCPIGPVVVTADEIPNPQSLVLTTRVNEHTVQASNTAMMVFGVAEILEHCSRHFTLEPGDLVLTGTPWGCGEFMSPPQHLHPGDVVEVEVERIGRLRNFVVGPPCGAS